MAIKPLADPKPRFIDKRKLQKAMDELNADMGFVRDPTVTAEKVQEMMLADGIRPEDCAFSREIIRMRYKEEEE